MGKDPYLLESIDELRSRALICKNRHFSGANRSKYFQILFGLPVVLINIILGSVFFVLLSKNIPNYSKWGSGILALIGAVMGGIQTFFNFSRNFEGHRKIGNKYLLIEQECGKLEALYFDGIFDLKQVAKEYENLLKTYHEVNIEAEAFPTTAKDYSKALKDKREQENYWSSPVKCAHESKNLTHSMGEAND